MKHGVNPTVKQKIRLKSCKLNPDNWLVIKGIPGLFLIEHRVSGKTRELRIGKEK